MDGFIIIDKPEGMTSHDVVYRIRKLTGQKTGHTGTLDPFATGVLPIAIGEATKAISYLDESVKSYEATIRFGTATDTYDRTGSSVLEGSWEGLNAVSVEKLIRSHVGAMKQEPPMYSALKLNGTPLYKLARRGVVVERKERDVVIHSIEVQNVALPEASFSVICSRGTYIRSLAHDIGVKAGCGAHLVSLRRTMSGGFRIGNAFTLDEVSAMASRGELPGVVVPIESALGHLVQGELTAVGASSVRNGVIPDDAEVSYPPGMDLSTGDRIRFSFGGRLVAVVEISVPIEGKISKSMRFLRVFN